MTGLHDGRADRVDGGLVDYAIVVWRYRWLVMSVLAAGLCLSAAVSLLSSKMYEATATLIAPKEGTSSGLLGNLAVVSGLVQQAPNVSVASMTPNRDMLVSILKSRTMAQSLVSRFRLQDRYRARYAEDAIRTLEDRVRILVSKEGVISVRTEDTDPQISADMANFYINELDRLVARYSTSEAGNQRAFLTEQLAHAKVALDGAEEKLRRFQEQNRAIALQEQTRGAIEATEQARIAEAKDLPMVQALDRAVPAERPSRPRLRLNIALGGVTGIFVGIFLAFLADYVENWRRGQRRP